MINRVLLEKNLSINGGELKKIKRDFEKAEKVLRLGKYLTGRWKKFYPADKDLNTGTIRLIHLIIQPLLEIAEGCKKHNIKL